MRRDLLATLTPSTLLARSNLVLAGSAAVIALTAIVALMAFVVRPIEDRYAMDEAGLIVLAAQTWVELPPKARLSFEIELLREHDLVITPAARELPPAPVSGRYFDLLEASLGARLGRRVELMAADDLLWADVPMGDYVMQVGFSAARSDVEPLYVGVVVVLVGVAILVAASAYVVRRVVRPIANAARAVGAFRGRGTFEPLREEGPEELVTLARSFNATARDISELLSNRTTLLAGISHDLRTPLTRMRFALELLPEGTDAALIERFERNLTTMDELISDALRFARGAGEEPRDVDFRQYFDSVAAAIDEKLTVDWRVADAGRVRIAAGAFRRVVANLVHNAQIHGGGARLLVRGNGAQDALSVHVVDDGPGIPEPDRAKVFQPFFRLESSRSRATGGSGLGLAIVDQLCQAHGWRVNLAPSDSGGTDASIRVPRAV